MTWKLVPVEPTGKMLASRVKEPTHLYGQDGRDEDYQRKMKVAVLVDRAVLISEWRDLLSASPDPTTDEALVERVARVIAKMFNEEEHWDLFRDEALAAIRAMEEKP